ncbi:DEKNAAC102099 [Brettanomyces naardenensis]|uniref:DEKNAAC102099 n=1 Tax=Brettanomyces naardenensis TaxID=13370 RepID=A0A448YJN4_BRENA|nr:DEKNAAC102099 [Brettanomyces naardenensis]
MTAISDHLDTTTASSEPTELSSRGLNEQPSVPASHRLTLMANDSADIIVDTTTSLRDGISRSGSVTTGSSANLPDSAPLPRTGSAVSLGRHNRFNPQLYNFSMANSPTIANLSTYTNSPRRSIVEDREEDHVEDYVPITESSVSGSSGSLGASGNSLQPHGSSSAGTENTPATHPDGCLSEDEQNVSEGTSEGLNVNGNAHPDLVETRDDTPVVVEDVRSASSVFHDMRGKPDENGFYSIRLTPFIDHSSSAPYMFFGPIIRKIKPGMKIAIGRYTEKCKSAATAPQGSSAAVVFKSKVVSRQHAQLSVDEDGQWYIKDARSSSGTFLNHVRMSMANVESSDFALNDSDILQLGMDYRGGSEEIYRCVKVKVELNYSWHRRGAKFSKEAHQRLKELTLTRKDEDLTPCVICLGPIKPCQAVFVASCSHSWHYKCIRPLIVKTYPQFMCPNCKAVCDIEADLDDEEEY